MDAGVRCRLGVAAADARRCAATATATTAEMHRALRRDLHKQKRQVGAGSGYCGVQSAAQAPLTTCRRSRPRTARRHDDHVHMDALPGGAQQRVDAGGRR